MYVMLNIYIIWNDFLTELSHLLIFFQYHVNPNVAILPALSLSPSLNSSWQRTLKKKNTQSDKQKLKVCLTFGVISKTFFSKCVFLQNILHPRIPSHALKGAHAN